MATRAQMFPSRYLKAEDLEGMPVGLTIEKAVTEMLKDYNTGKMQAKTVVYFEETDKILVLSSKTNWTSIEEIAGPDSDDWAGAKIELYPTETEVKGKMTPCIRIRPVTRKPAAKLQPKKSALPVKKSVLPKQEEEEPPPHQEIPEDHDPEFGADYDDAAE
jgi:hypothetical protein